MRSQYRSYRQKGYGNKKRTGQMTGSFSASVAATAAARTAAAFFAAIVVAVAVIAASAFAATASAAGRFETVGLFLLGGFAHGNDRQPGIFQIFLS